MADSAIAREIPRHTPPLAWAVPGLAWGMWVAMTAASFWYVSAYACSLPFSDEMGEFIDVVCGRLPATFAWFWAPHNEHRMFLGKLIYVGLGLATDYDFRAGTFWNVAMLASLSAVLMLTARSLRGRTSLCDAFFPLAIQHWGQPLNLLWSFQVAFTTGTALGGIALTLVAGCRGSISLLRALAVATCLLGAGLCGSNGIPLVPALACWLLLAVIVGRSDERRPLLQRWGQLLLAIALFALAVAYFVGFDKPLESHSTPGLGAILLTSLEFLSTSLGMVAAHEVWPASGILMLLGSIVSAAHLVWVFLRRPQERVRAAGFLAFLGGMVLLALGVGWGRGIAAPGAGMQDRYVTLSLPLLCLFYLQGLVYGRPAFRSHLHRGLFLIMCVLVVVNCRKGLSYAQSFKGYFVRLEADMRARIPAEGLAMRHGDRLAFGPTDAFARQLEMLREARRGPYRDPAACQTDSRIRVERLVELRQPGQHPHRWTLAPGQEFVQPFSLPGGVALTRIDVEMDSIRHHALPRRLDWTLYRRGPTGQQTVVAHGQANPAELEVGQYVSLQLGEIGFPQAAELALGVTLSPDTSDREGLCVLLYDGPTPGHLAGKEAQRPSCTSLRAFWFAIQLPSADLSR